MLIIKIKCIYIIYLYQISLEFCRPFFAANTA